MRPKLEFHSFESKYYVGSVALVTVAVAGFAWYSRSVSLAFCAALLGLYVLHLLSMRFMFQVQREQRSAFEEQLELLQQLVGKATLGRESMSAAPVEVPGTAAPAAPADDNKPSVPSAPQLVVLSPTIARQSTGAAATHRQEADPQELDRVAVPRHFALGTVAIVRDALSPAEVARILVVQREQPGRRFGEVAVELGLLADVDLTGLLEAQKRGLFTDAEIRRARERLEVYRREQAEMTASAG